MSAMDRRSFLKTSALGAAAAAVWLEAPSLARAAEGGHLVPLAVRPPNYESVRSTFTTRLTPLDRFYLRNHHPIPAVDAQAWRLAVHGMVEEELSLSLQDLERMPQTTVEAVLQCAGNGRALFNPRVPGVQWRWGAMGNAEWSGVRLVDLLVRARPKDGFRWLQMTGAEKPVMDTTPRFIRGLPFEKALHPDTIVALRMNGKPIPPNHGGPARLVVPGWVADGWTKSAVDFELRPDEPKGFYFETAYRYPERPGAPGEPVPASLMKPMTRLRVKSLLASVSDGDMLAARPRELVGVAFSGEAGIEKVEVSVDGGASWAPAKLDGPATPYGFRVFRFPWRPAEGRHVLACRATDANGAVQPEAPEWNPAGYLYNAIDKVTVHVGVRS